jgi:hypothetical protein
MPLKLDNSLLDELGLTSLPDAEKQSLLRHIYETLEMRVGMRLADQMSNEQLDEFEQFVNANDDNGAFKWLESNFPNYKDVVNDEFEKLKGEVGQVAPQILSQSQQAAVAGPQPQPGQPMPVATDPNAMTYQAGPQPQQPQQSQQPQMPQTPQQPMYAQQPQQQHAYQTQPAPVQPFANPNSPGMQPQQPAGYSAQQPPQQPGPQYPQPDYPQQQPPQYPPQQAT